MIDTIILLIPLEQVTITNSLIFNPTFNANNIINSPDKGPFITSSFIPSKKNYKKFNYLPRLTLIRKFKRPHVSSSILRIEFSASKLVFGNNFLELSNSDLKLVVSHLQLQLTKIGIHVDQRVLTSCKISTIHYSKNILLRDYTSPHTYTKLLAKADINKQLDINRSDYRNEGHSLQYHNNSFELVFYDKIKDLQKSKTSEKRAIEKDNSIQLPLLEKLAEIKPLEVLRIEVRLNSKRKINHVLGLVKLNQEHLNLKTLFNKKISKVILNYYFQITLDKIPSIMILDQTSSKAVLTSIINKNRHLSIAQTLKLLGLHQILKEVGVREFREIIKHKPHAWYSLKKEMGKIELPISTNPLTKIKKSLEIFEIIKWIS